ncbi:hypothetical protein ACWDUL_20300 [Nocardia niigatensis]
MSIADICLYFALALGVVWAVITKDPVRGGVAGLKVGCFLLLVIPSLLLLAVLL